MAHRRSISTVFDDNQKKGTLLMKAPSLYTDEKTNQRLTFAGMLARHAGVFPEEQVEFFMRNENREQLLELLSVVAHLGRDQRIALKASTKTDSPTIIIPGELAQEWESFWKIEYGVKADFAGLPIPRQPLGYKARFCLMNEKVAQSAEFFFQSDKVAYGGKVWKFTDKSLDDVEMTHKHTGTFGFWVADEQEAPDGCLGKETATPINLHTVAVRELGWTTETVPMRQLHGRVHWKQRGAHLDKSVVTFCSDSALPGVNVPVVYFDPFNGAVYVDYFGVQGVGDKVRFRRAVLYLKPSC